MNMKIKFMAFALLIPFMVEAEKVPRISLTEDMDAKPAKAMTSYKTGDAKAGIPGKRRSGIFLRTFGEHKDFLRKLKMIALQKL